MNFFVENIGTNTYLSLGLHRIRIIIITFTPYFTGRSSGVITCMELSSAVIIMPVSGILPKDLPEVLLKEISLISEMCLWWLLHLFL